DFGIVHKVYGVAITFGHFASIGPWKHKHLRVKLPWFGEHLAAIVVETPDDFPSQLDMRRLILSNRNVVSFVHYDVGGLKNRITEKQVVADVFFSDILALLLVGWHALQPAQRRERRQYQV